MSTPFTSYVIQRTLGVSETGQFDAQTAAAIRAALGWPQGWSTRRLIIGYQQKLMREAGIEVTIDGLLGPATIHAFERYQDLLRKQPEEQAKVAAAVGWFNWRSVVNWFKPAAPIPTVGKVVIPPKIDPLPPPAVRAPLMNQDWPRQRNVPAFFGAVGKNQTIITCPWEMELAWDPSVTTRRISLHEKVAPSAARVLARVWQEYGPEGIRELGLYKYGGSLNVRKMRGGDSYSMHAWGIAIDWDPDRNGLRMNHTQARLARPDAVRFWNAWEAEGWLSLGRERDFDWMHVQAARL